jgi:hypothetical protein
LLVLLLCLGCEKWWKMLQILNFPSVFDTAMERFDGYLAKSSGFPIDTSFQEAVAVIAFQSYVDVLHPEMAYRLTLMSLGATIESLRRAGMGRVVVVGTPKSLDVEGMDQTIAEDTFRYLKFQVEGTKVSNSTQVAMLGSMEVGFVGFEKEYSNTTFLKKNVPRAALMGLREAILLGKKEEQLAPNQIEQVEEWLGDKKHPTYWKYIYLTEPDSILQTRPATLKQLKFEVDKGMILMPHRLQPIPHEDDAHGHQKKNLYLPSNFKPVIELDAIGEHDACCDTNQRPGRDYPSCGNFWYMCDLSEGIAMENRTYDRLKLYPLIKLKQGTEIVSLAALEHGRMCLPTKNNVCVPPVVEEI